jgi:hypothetical protein
MLSGAPWKLALSAAIAQVPEVVESAASNGSARFVDEGQQVFTTVRNATDFVVLMLHSPIDLLQPDVDAVSFPTLASLTNGFGTRTKSQAEVSLQNLSAAFAAPLVGAGRHWVHLPDSTHRYTFQLQGQSESVALEFIWRPMPGLAEVGSWTMTASSDRESLISLPTGFQSWRLFRRDAVQFFNAFSPTNLNWTNSGGGMFFGPWP